MDLVAAGYERVDQVEDRGQFAIRGGLLDVFPATEDRAVRVDLFGDEIESLRWFSTFTQRSLGDAELVEIAPAAELAEEHRELAEIAALENEADRPDIAELLPVENFHPFLDLAPDDAAVLIAGEEDVAPALADHWQDVSAAFKDRDARHLYVDAEAIDHTLRRRARIRLSSIDQDQPFSFRAQAADVQARGLKEAEPELEKLARSGYHTVVAFARRGEGERAAYNLGRLKVRWLDPGESASADKQITFAHARLQQGFIAPQFHLAVIPEHRLFRRRRAPEQPERTRRRGVLRSFADLRTGDIVVHEDHGIARFAGFDTKTVANVTRDYLYLEYAGSDRVFVPVDQLAKISRFVGAGGTHPPLSKLGGTRWDTLKARARRAAQELAGELLNLYAERKRREGHAVPAGQRLAARLRGRVPVHRDARPARRDRDGQGRHGGAAPDGPADLRRRRLRQDRGGAAGRVQVGAGRQAGDAARADHDPRPAALRHVHRALEGLPDHDRARLALPSASRTKRSRQALQRGQGRHPHRDAPLTKPRHPGQGPRPADRRRGAALRRQAEGAAAPAQAEGRRDLDERHPDPAHAADVDGRDPRHQRDRDPARGPPADQDLRRGVRRGTRQDRPDPRARTKRPGVLPPQPDRDDRRDRRAAARPVPEHALRGRPRADGRAPARAADARRSCAATPTCSCARASSSRGSTSRRPTR